ELSLSGQYFFRLPESFSRRVLVSNALRYDQGFPLRGAVLLPAVERFTAGGDSTVRGYEEDRVHTEIIESPVQPISGVSQFKVVPAGGNVRVIHNLDVQVEVWDHSFVGGMPIASAVFLDTGLVTNSFQGFHVSQIRQGLGIAIARLITPIG